MAKGVFGIILLDAGLILMLLSFILMFGLGLEAGLFAAVGAPMLIAGIALDRSWARMVVFAVGVAFGCVWLYVVATGL